MAFMKQINELTGILFLMLFGFPLIASTNIDCNGKAFHCVNSTHFMICVDLGGGVSSTVDDFVIACPPPTVCQGKNRFECEFPAVTSPLPTLRESEATTLPWEDNITTIFPKNTSESDHSDIKTLNTVSSSTLPENRVTLMPMDTDKNGTNEVATSTESTNNNETLKLNETSTLAYGNEKIPETNNNSTHVDGSTNFSVKDNQSKFNETGNILNTNTSTITVNYTKNVPISEKSIKNTTNLTANFTTESTFEKDKTTVLYDAKLDNTATTLFEDYTTNFTTTVPNNIKVTENYIAENTTQTEASTTASLKVDGLDNIIDSVNQNTNQQFNKSEVINQTIDRAESNISQVGDIFQSPTLSTSTFVIEKQTTSDFSQNKTQVKPLITSTLEYGTYTSPTDMLPYDTVNINFTNQPGLAAGEIITTEIITPKNYDKIKVGEENFPFFITTQPSMPVVETITVINTIASRINRTSTVKIPQDLFLNKTESILPRVQEIKIAPTDNTDTKIDNNNVLHQSNNENTLPSVFPIETHTLSAFSPSILEATTVITTLESRINSTSTDKLPQELFLNKTETILPSIVEETIISPTESTVPKFSDNKVVSQSTTENTLPSVFPIETHTLSGFSPSILEATTVLTTLESRMNSTSTDKLPQELFLNKTETILSSIVEETIISPTESTVPKFSDNNVVSQSKTENTLPSVFPIETQTPSGFSPSILETTTVTTTLDSRIDSTSTDTLPQELFLNKTESIWPGIVQEMPIATTDNTVTKIGNYPVLPQSASQNTVPSAFPIETQTTSGFLQIILDTTTVINIPESRINSTSRDIFFNKTETILPSIVEETITSPTENTVPKLSNNNVVPQSTAENTLPSVLPIETQTPSGVSQSKLQTTTGITTLESRIDTSTDTLPQELFLNKTESIWPGIVQEMPIATTENTVTKIGNHPVLPQSASQNTVPSVFPIETQTTSGFLQSILDTTTVITIPESRINSTSTDILPQDIFINKRETILATIVEEMITSPTENTAPKFRNNNVVLQSTTENILPSVLPIETQTPSGFSQSILESNTVFNTITPRVNSTSSVTLPHNLFLNKTESFLPGIAQETTIPTTDNTNMNIGNNNVVYQNTTEKILPSVLLIETQTPSGFSQSLLETTTAIPTLESRIDSLPKGTLPQDLFLNKTQSILPGVVQETTIAITENIVTKIGNHTVLPQSISQNTMPNVLPIETQTTSGFLKSILETTTRITILESRMNGTSTDTLPQDIFSNKTETFLPGIVQETTIATTDNTDTKIDSNNVIYQSITESTLPSVLPIETQTPSDFPQSILETITVITTPESTIDSTSRDTSPQNLSLKETAIATTDNTITKVGNNTVIPQSTRPKSVPSVLPIETQTYSGYLQGMLETTTVITTVESSIHGTSTDTFINKTETTLLGFMEETTIVGTDNTITKMSNNKTIPQSTSQNKLPSVLPNGKQTTYGFSQSMLDTATVNNTTKSNFEGSLINTFPQDPFMNKTKTILPDTVEETITATDNTVVKIGNNKTSEMASPIVHLVLPQNSDTQYTTSDIDLQSLSVMNTLASKINDSSSNISHQDLNKTFIKLPSNTVSEITTKIIIDTTYVPTGEMNNNDATLVSLENLEKVSSFSDKITTNTTEFPSSTSEATVVNITLFTNPDLNITDIEVSSSLPTEGISDFTPHITNKTESNEFMTKSTKTINEDVSNAITFEKTYPPEQNVFTTTTNYSETSNVVIIPSTQIKVSTVPVKLNRSDSSPILLTSEKSLLLPMHETTTKPAVMDVEHSYFNPTGNDIIIPSTQIGTTTVNDATSTPPNTLQSVTSNKSIQYNGKAILTNDTKVLISQGTDIGLMTQTQLPYFEEISATTLKSDISNTLININNKTTQIEAISPKKYENPILNLLLNSSIQIEDIDVSTAASNVEISSFQQSANDLLREPISMIKTSTPQPAEKDLNLSTLAEIVLTMAPPSTGPILQEEDTSYKLGSVALTVAQENNLVNRLRPILITSTRTPKLYNTTQIKESETASASTLTNTENIVSSPLDVSQSEEVPRMTTLNTEESSYDPQKVRKITEEHSTIPTISVGELTKVPLKDYLLGKTGKTREIQSTTEAFRAQTNPSKENILNVLTSSLPLPEINLNGRTKTMTTTGLSEKSFLNNSETVLLNKAGQVKETVVTVLRIFGDNTTTVEPKKAVWSTGTVLTGNGTNSHHIEISTDVSNQLYTVKTNLVNLASLNVTQEITPSIQAIETAHQISKFTESKIKAPEFMYSKSTLNEPNYQGLGIKRLTALGQVSNVYEMTSPILTGEIAYTSTPISTLIDKLRNDISDNEATETTSSLIYTKQEHSTDFSPDPWLGIKAKSNSHTKDFNIENIPSITNINTKENKVLNSLAENYHQLAVERTPTSENNNVKIDYHSHTVLIGKTTLAPLISKPVIEFNTDGVDQDSIISSIGITSSPSIEKNFETITESSLDYIQVQNVGAKATIIIDTGLTTEEQKGPRMFVTRMSSNDNEKSYGLASPFAEGTSTKIDVVTSYTEVPEKTEEQNIVTTTKGTSSNMQITSKVTPKPQNFTPKYTVTDNDNIKINGNPKISSTSPHYTCRNRRRGRYADNTDCRKFYICSGRETPIIGLCPVNTVFSEMKTQCTRTLSHCIRDNQFKCVSEGRFGDFLKPNVYYICVKNKVDSFVRFKFQCQNGYYLNRTSVRCLQNSEELSRSISNYSISKKTIEKKSKEDSRSDSRKEFECEKEGKFPDPNNCRGYYVCTKSKHSEEFRRRKKKCDSEEMFNKKKKKCVEAESDECSK